jgi:hypothetical protein
MTRGILVKLGLAAILVGVTALPARAGLVTVTEFDGVNISYTATVTPLGGGNDILTISYDVENLVTKINGSVVAPPLSSIWSAVGGPGNGDYTTVAENIAQAGDGSVNFTTSDPAAGLGNGGGDIGITDDTGVVLNYLVNSGQTTTAGLVEGLNLGGTINLDTVNFPGNSSQLVVGSTTYDFSLFGSGSSAVTSFIITLNSSQDLIDSLLTGTPGTFSGTASFTAVAMVVPEPTSVVLLGMGGVLTTLASRRRRKA